jgi:type IV pilus assembly protein PilN
MANINLLPWRQELRAELKKQFFTVLIGTCFIGAGVVYMYDMKIQSDITFQMQGNEKIIAETKKLEEDIKEIDLLTAKRNRLIDRMAVIQNLQGNRSVIVHQFDELVRAIPDGVYLTYLEKKGEKFSIEGVADANNRVSNLMRNLDKSDWFSGSSLTSVTSKDDKKTDEDSASKFKLTAVEEKQNKDKPAESVATPIAAAPVASVKDKNHSKPQNNSQK